MTMSRAWVYGDLLFETIKVINGKAVYALYHYNRITFSADIVGFKLPANWSLTYFEELIAAHAQTGNKRGRLVISRLATGFYLPNSDEVSFSFEAWELPKPKLFIKTLDVYYQQFKACNTLSNTKSGNALIYVLAAKFAKEKEFDDVLILNQYDRIAEATSSNVFIVKNGVVKTPPLTEGPVAGVMRAQVLDLLSQLEIQCVESPLTLTDLFEAEECFLSNVLHGVVFVERFRTKNYKNTLTKVIQKALQKKEAIWASLL